MAAAGFECPWAFTMTICLRPVSEYPLILYCPKLGENQPEAKVVVVVAGVVVITVRRAAVPGVVVPAATAVHAVRPTLRLSPIYIFKHALRNF